jgi:predicted TIM-barrel fold metal-dependent hydrolase
MTLHGAEASSRTDVKDGADCACCHRRAFVKGASAAALATLASGRNASAQPASTGADKPFRIDVHHHLSSPGFIEAIRSRKTGQIPLENWTPAKSLEDMDKGAVATAMLSISKPSVNFGDDVAARALARETNEYGARLIADHPGRFGMYATVPLPDVEGSLREIAYALDTLKLDGICMMTDYRGKFLGDPSFWPVMEELNRRGAIVYTHPFRNDCCRNLVPDVFEPIIELGTDTTRTIASLMFSGTAAKFPDIKFIFSHAGGTAPYLMQRFTFCSMSGRIYSRACRRARRFTCSNSITTPPAPPPSIRWSRSPGWCRRPRSCSAPIFPFLRPPAPRLICAKPACSTPALCAPSNAITPCG